MRKALIGIVVALVLGLVGVTAPAWAWWTDSASGTLTVTAFTVPAPQLSCVNTSSGGIAGIGATYTASISWPVITSPYALQYTASVGGKDVTSSISTANGTKSLAVTSSLLTNLLGSLLGSSTTARITATLPGTSWTATKSWDITTGLLGTGPACTGSAY